MNTIVTFGEIMGRFETQNQKKLVQSLPGTLSLTFGGAEANVATSLSYMGKKTRYITALPENVLGKACKQFLHGFQIDLSYIQDRPERLGLYFLESGANQRPSSIVYDRAHTAISNIDASSIDWGGAFGDAQWFHTTGITPSLSEKAATATLKAVQEAKKSGLTVSCDLNFRKKLWQWQEKKTARELAEATMRKILPFVDVVIANEEDCADVLNIHAAHSDVLSGNLDVEAYQVVAEKVVSQFANVKKVAITLRESVSATHNNWGALLYDAAQGQIAYAPIQNGPNGQYKPYEIHNIVDRVGGGDSFGAGLIFALTSPKYAKLQDAINYAVAASCLCHSISGDINYSSCSEVETLMKGDGSGRVQR